MSQSEQLTAASELSLPRALARKPGDVRFGLFLPNQHHAHYITAAEGQTEADYESVRRVSVLSEEIGLSFLLPVARWKGLKGEQADFCPFGLETITLTGALLEATSRIVVFTTMHTELFNPAVAAKMGATLDNIGAGRWGLNVVAGWSKADFESMGFELRSYEDRYEHAREWLAAVRDLWVNGVSSYSCKYFTLDEAECKFQPIQEGGPVVVNAGQSPTGMKFAIDNADYLFSADATADQFRVVNEELGGGGVGYIGRKHIVVRPTRAEAEATANAIVEGGDPKAIAQLIAHGKGPVAEAEEALAKDPDKMRNFLLQKPILGDPGEVASQLAEWITEASVDGVCLSLFDQEEMLELFGDQVFEKLGNELDQRGKTLKLEL